MGLFMKKRKVCPICNSPIPRIFSTRIEGVPICWECDSRIDLPDGMTDQMSLAGFRQYLDFYEQNKALRNIFTETYRMNFTAFSSILVLDTANRLFRLKEIDTSMVMEASDLKSFRILEDNVPLFEGEGDTLKCHSSQVPALVESMAPQITQFLMQQEMYKQLERMEREDREEEKNGKRTRSLYYVSSPNFDAPVPFKHFYVELTLTHPYWGGFRGKLDAPGFNRYSPSVDAYMRDYQEKADQLYTLAVNLMMLINPSAQEVRDVDGEKLVY